MDRDRLMEGLVESGVSNGVYAPHTRMAIAVEDETGKKFIKQMSTKAEAIWFCSSPNESYLTFDVESGKSMCHKYLDALKNKGYNAFIVGN